MLQFLFQEIIIPDTQSRTGQRTRISTDEISSDTESEESDLFCYERIES